MINNEKILIKQYWDRRSYTYDRSPSHIWNSQEVKEAWKELLFRVLEENKNKKILDVGTGTGFLSLLLAELGYEVVGVDLSEKMLEKAREKAAKYNLKIRFEVGEAENLDFKDNSFDAVVCRHLLWTLPNPQKAVKEWIRVTKHGGRIIAVDGKWQCSSFSERIRRTFGNVAILLLEKRNPWNLNYKEIKDKLPFYGGIGPEEATKFFELQGLANVSVELLQDLTRLQRRYLPLLYRIAWNHTRFIVKGEVVKW